MTATSDKLTQLATDFANAFERDTRNDGQVFYKLKADSPQWMTDAIFAAHGDMMPNDWIYEKCCRVAQDMADYNPEKWEDSAAEWADSNVDIYNADRSAWLASHLDFAADVDDAVENFGHSEQGIFGDLGVGQYCVIERIASALIAAVQEQAEDSDDENN